ncbi:MAG: thioredoxin family protein [Candidatus Nanohaloarchaea archaeon]|nr:thioredoxin family protein [Candidatus Nanohaloarchaea archaeon]
MHVLQVFYVENSEACQRTLRILEKAVEQEEETAMVAHDVTKEEGQRRAEEFDINTVPTTVVDGDRVIRGVPQSPEQVIQEEN